MQIVNKIVDSASVQQFIQAIEIWVPGTDSHDLVLASASYGDLEAFKTTSETMCFAYDEGLPGKTWSTRQPIVLTDFSKSYFQRAEAAERARIECGLSFPVFCGDFLQAVVVLFCGGGANVVGAMEVWHNTTDSELELVDGYYGEMERFEWVSRRLSIMKGRGLPGSAWEKCKPVIIDDLGNSNSFLRASNAAKVGITTGLAIPYFNMGSDVQVLVFLSAKGTPIARRFEIWLPDADNHTLHFDAGQCIAGRDLPAKYAGARIKKGEGLLGQCWLTGRPTVAPIDDEDGDVIIVLPVIDQGALNSIVSLVL
jgi:hypothetical protein